MMNSNIAIPPLKYKGKRFNHKWNNKFKVQKQIFPVPVKCVSNPKKGFVPIQREIPASVKEVLIKCASNEKEFVPIQREIPTTEACSLESNSLKENPIDWAPYIQDFHKKEIKSESNDWYLAYYLIVWNLLIFANFPILFKIAVFILLISCIFPKSVKILFVVFIFYIAANIFIKF